MTGTGRPAAATSVRARAIRVGALAIAALAVGCAGSGKSYACDLDAGPCNTTVTNDGGALPSFFGTPVLVAHDGLHDGFGDLAGFRGQIYAAFRRGKDRGYDGSAQVQIVRSADRGQTWQPVTTLSLPGFDLRDPKLAVFKDRLSVSFTAWDVKDPTKNRTFVRFAFSSDGQVFTLADAPLLPQASGLSAWRPRAKEGALWLPVWVADELFEHPELDHLSLLRSADGANFELATTLPIGGGGFQPEVLVRAGGKLLLTAPEQAALGQPQRQSFCQAPAAAPQSWSCWTVSGQHVETPALYEWNGLVLLAGKHDLGDGRKRTGLWQVFEDNRSLSLVAELDSFGDTGALGFYPLDADTALFAYHSTSRLDPKYLGLGHEPTEVETISIGLASDVMAVSLSLRAAPIGN